MKLENLEEIACLILQHESPIWLSPSESAEAVKYSRKRKIVGQEATFGNQLYVFLTITRELRLKGKAIHWLPERNGP